MLKSQHGRKELASHSTLEVTGYKLLLRDTSILCSFYSSSEQRSTRKYDLGKTNSVLFSGSGGDSRHFGES